ncbi:MAG: di-heme oxidoredictase family protein [Parvularculales bacterium]
MRALTYRKWLVLGGAIFLLSGLVLLGTVLFEDEFSLINTDPHLNIIPRTEVEAERIKSATMPPADFSTPQRFEEMSGGAATVRVLRNADAFSQPSKNIPFEGELDFHVGNGLFRKLWVSSPSSTLASDGLGPLFNARACQRCHIKDGRGHPPADNDDNAISLLMRIGIPTLRSDLKNQIKAYLATKPDSNYGSQIQDLAVAGQAAEARVHITYEEIEVPLAGGEVAMLRKPAYTLVDPGYGPLHPDVQISPRVAPQMIGLGLLEAIPAKDILAHADPDDANNDGISGRPNVVWSYEFERPMLGRFGLKAGKPTIHEQAATAFSADIGISSPLFPAPAGDCTSHQHACVDAPHGDSDERGTEIDQTGMDLVTFYSRNLAVPMRRDVDDPDVLRGKEVFTTTGCASCHQPSFVTHRLSDRPEQSFQLIWPYTDMLLHDMGPGLADGLPEGAATGSEWRTSPLWGIGLTEQVSGHTNFLHDGRARSLLEAILWHGGEAQPQRDAVTKLRPEDRAALIKFLESL